MIPKGTFILRNTPPSNQQINLRPQSFYYNQPNLNQPHWNPYPQQDAFSQFSQQTAFSQFSQPNAFPFDNPNYGSQTYMGGSSSQLNMNQPMYLIPPFPFEEM